MKDKLIYKLLFPRHCVICDRALKLSDEGICEECSPVPLIVPAPRCSICGKAIRKGRNTCHDCSIKRPEYNYGRALYEYRSVQDSISRFKNVGRVEYGRFYGRQMATLLAEEIGKMNAEAIVPVPLHRDKLIYRGYNQAAILAKEISDYHNIPLREDLLIRVRKSEDQKKLDVFQRQNNLKKAFHIAQNDVKLKDIIVVDDVYTTGSTISTISSLLKEHGAENVYFLTLAIGKGM